MAIRKPVTDLTIDERNRFKDAVQQLVNDPLTFSTLIAHHADGSHRMHSVPAAGTNDPNRHRFLPWHRRYLLEIERALQNIDPLCFVPYWRWTAQRHIPNVIVGLLPTVSVGGLTITVTRTVPLESQLPSRQLVQTILTQQEFFRFTNRVEHLLYDVVRTWVGGTMDTANAAADPLYWMHLAMIDKLWSDWQVSHHQASDDPTLSVANAALDPFTAQNTAQLVRQITDLGYSYQP